MSIRKKSNKSKDPLLTAYLTIKMMIIIHMLNCFVIEVTYICSECTVIHGYAILLTIDNPSPVVTGFKAYRFKLVLLVAVLVRFR